MNTKNKARFTSSNDNKSGNTNEHNIKRRGRTGRRTKEMVAIAKERINILMVNAETEAIHNNNSARANRYVELSRKIGMRYNVRIDKKYSNMICRGCNTYLGTSETARVRCQSGRMIITCKNCGRVKRFPISDK